MGKEVTHTSALDPSSIISYGIAVGNMVLAPLSDMGLLSVSVCGLIGLLVYACVIFVFLTVALDVSLILIMTSALITVSCFFLGFGALSATTAIARQSLDVILANCIKLLGYYLVIGAGLKTFALIADPSLLPQTMDALKEKGLDCYVWLMGVTWLFYLTSKNLPQQMAKIVSSGIQESQGTGVAALAMSALRIANNPLAHFKGGAMGMAATGLKNLAKLATNATGLGALAQAGAGFAKAGMNAVKSSVFGGGSSASAAHSTPNSSATTPPSSGGSSSAGPSRSTPKTK
jgi:hypothetical protein